MDTDTYKDIESWFEGYAQRILAGNVEVQDNIELKKKHILKAVDLTVHLAGTMDKYADLDITAAKIVAIAQHLARFNDFAKATTGEEVLGEKNIDACIAIIEEEKVLEELSEEQKNTVLECLKYVDSNTFPKSLSEEVISIVKLVSDACKVSALEVVSEYYGLERQGTNKIIEFNLPNKFEISAKLQKRIMDDRVAEAKDVHSIKDLKLMQMSWVFALNFKESYKIVYNKSYVKKIYETLPKSDKIIDMYRRMRIHLENQL